jgi:thiamine-phosphate pyrophosphorylase
MLLYLIVDASLCDAVSTARSAAAAGVDFIQLRFQGATDAQYTALAREVMSAIASTHTKFIVGERPHLVPRLGAAGVHIGEKYRDIQTAREEIGAGPILGVSGFTPEAVAALVGEDFPVDYLSIGPVWTTVSKPDAGAAIGVAETVVRAQANLYHSALIGGVTAANAGELVAAVGNLPGAMIVVLGEVCRAADPAAAVRAIRASIGN